MEFAFDITLKTRKIFIDLLNELSLDHLNKIPEGFSNNIYWNIKHVVVTQQMLVYGLSNLPMQVSAAEIEAFRKGTKPTVDATPENADTLKEQLLVTLEQTIEDYKAEKFMSFKEYEVTTKTVLTSAKQAIEFNNFHEGIHLGYVLALKHLI